MVVAEERAGCNVGHTEKDVAELAGVVNKHVTHFRVRFALCAWRSQARSGVSVAILGNACRIGIAPRGDGCRASSSLLPLVPVQTERSLFDKRHSSLIHDEDKGMAKSCMTPPGPDLPHVHVRRQLPTSKFLDPPSSPRKQGLKETILVRILTTRNTRISRKHVLEERRAGPPPSPIDHRTTRVSGVSPPSPVRSTCARTSCKGFAQVNRLS